MSVIRQPGVLGRTTRQRVVGLTAALSAAALETLAVAIWFGLVVGSRTTSTALAGLGILFCGALLRAGVFGATVNELGELLEPRRLGAATILTGGWIVWLLLAEQIGGQEGVVLATLALAIVLTAQFEYERRVFGHRSIRDTSFTPIVPAVLLAVGASALLGSAWFIDWTLTSPPIALEITTVVIRIEAVQLGGVVFGLFAFIAHQRRFQRLLSHC
ncbi:hypothetical protein G6M89_08575 [Natronolimnobius sp. AArcel1]|uniref:hypothetical protein n=1 Tax=Natronolimnobius sp. AArcel1 TaxID=1679093 RepID=UPI0013EBF3BF|nr:hypothetical protein [Natronolimnobius sp. AArcel1]NGM69063.1 hypothetical protein [Natronolimnobius sp. AArcel1]